MKKLLLSLAGFIVFSTVSFSQTTLFQDDFESGSGNWTLNVGGFGSNDWIVNNAYTGGIFTTTPNQPGAITNSPNSQYMHIYNPGLACGSFNECQAIFLAGSGGDKTAEMTSPISTIGMTNVTLDFWYLCMGDIATYGLVEYSLDGGSSWSAASPNYQGQFQWLAQSLTNVAWDNQASLKFRLHWIESVTGNDPSFSFDEFIITGTSGGASNTITTATNLTPTSWCEGNPMTFQVNFTSTGTFTAGNIYTAELSDATGSFAAPTAIGTLASTANSGMIVGLVLGSTPAGAGYRIRVVSDSPVTIGVDNGVDLTIGTPPTVGLGVLADACETAPFYTLTAGSPAGGTYTGPGITGGVFDPAVAGAGTHNVTYFFTDGNGCSGEASGSIIVNPSPSVSFLALDDVCDYTAAFPVSGGLPIGGVYSGPGIVGLTFDPSVAGIGSHILSYTYTDMVTGCIGEEVQTIIVDGCLSIDEKGLENMVLYPNPVSESFQLISENVIESVQVLEMSGRIVKSFGAAQLSYDISAIPSGIYMVTVQTADHIGQLRIIVK